MLKNSSKLIYFDKYNMTLRAFLKSYLILKIEKYIFLISEQMNMRKNIFFQGISYMLWANE